MLPECLLSKGIGIVIERKDKSVVMSSMEMCLDGCERWRGGGEDQERYDGINDMCACC